MEEKSRFGVCQLKEGEYTGEVVDGLLQGYGEMKFNNYDTYEGDWEAGKMHGFGKYNFWDRKKDRYVAHYEGWFSHGVREGKGKMVYSNRDVYQGYWQNNMRTGNGVCWFADGSIFHGIWKFDKMVRGVYRKKDGLLYDGELKDGKFNGYGKLYWPSGKWFEGLFVDNKPYKGVLLTPDGKMCEFNDGQQI